MGVKQGSRVCCTESGIEKEKTLSMKKLDLNLRKKLVNCFVWC